jgi:hypothetical protein
MLRKTSPGKFTARTPNTGNALQAVSRARHGADADSGRPRAPPLRTSCGKRCTPTPTPPPRNCRWRRGSASRPLRRSSLTGAPMAA